MILENFRRMNNWLVYLVRCSDNSIYCGITNNIGERVKAHNEGRGARYTKTRLPVTLLLTSRVMSRRDALRLEHQVKKQKANKKVDYLKLFSRAGNE